MRLAFTVALLALAAPVSAPGAFAQSGRAPSDRDSVVIVTRGRTVVVEGAGDSARVVLRREGRRTGDTLRLRMPDVERLMRRVRIFEEDGESSISLDSLARRTGRRWRARIDSLFGPSGDSLRLRFGAADGVRLFRPEALDGFRPHPEALDYDLLTLPGRDARRVGDVDGADGVIERRIERRHRKASGGEREVIVHRRGDHAPVRVTVEGDILRIVDEAGERTVRIPRHGAPTTSPETRPDGTVVPDALGGVWIYIPPSRSRG